MLNFTVGPVMSCDEVRRVAGEQVPYFRTAEFSSVMLENEVLIKTFAKAEDDARVVFITGSGTASMEASVINCFTKKDKLLIVNGGSFGERFCQICEAHEIPFTQIKLPVGSPLTQEMLANYDNKGYTGFLVNVHETSTGVHYDIDLISKFCRKNNIFLIVDAISSFLADEFNMKDLGVDVMITGSQKALACAPGISVIVLSKNAIDRVNKSKVKSLYFNLKTALLDGERGQTPFTPAVSTLLQINERLNGIKNSGGVDAEIQRTKNLATYFRQKIKDFPFEFITSSPSNAVTALSPKNMSAYDIFLTLKDKYSIWVCPNGGQLKDKIFRVGHIGYLQEKDYDTLINAMLDMKQKGLIY